MFKRGDVIKCIDASESNNLLTLHKEYRVMLEIANSEMVWIIDDTKTADKYFTDRFVLVSVSRTLIRKMFAQIRD